MTQGLNVVQLQDLLKWLAERNQIIYRDQPTNEITVLFDNAMQFDAVCSYGNRILVAIATQHSISEVTLKKYSVGLSGNIINLCDYPEAVQKCTHLDLHVYVHVIHIAIACKNGGVFKFNDGHWNVVIDLQVHAFVFQNDHQGDIIYTDSQSHLSRNSRSETLTGTGTVGNRDQPTNICQFVQHTGILST